MTSAIEDQLDVLERESPFALRLAELASLAVRIDAGLLRRLRRALLPEADAGAESDLWFSSLVESRGPDGFQLSPAAATLLRDRLKTLPQRPTVAAVRAVLDDAHRLVSPAIRLEEEVNGLALEKGTDAGEDIDVALRPALHTLAKGGDEAAQVARWAFHAAARFHPMVLETASARLLVLTSALVLRSQVRDTSAVAPPALADLGWALSQTTIAGTHLVGVTFVHGGLQFHDSTDEATAIAVPAIRPRFVQLEWVASGTTRSVLAEAADRVLVPLDGDPQNVTLTTLTGEQYEIGAAPGVGGDSLFGHPAFPPEDLLGACLGIQPLGHDRPLGVAFAIAQDLAVTSDDRVEGYPIVGATDRSAHLEVIYRSVPKYLDGIAVLHATESLGATGLRLMLTSETETLRGAVAGVTGGSPAWFDVVLPAKRDEWRTRTGILLHPPDLAADDLTGAFVGSPFVVDGRAAGLVRGIWPPGRGHTYATVEVVTALLLSSAVALARAHIQKPPRPMTVFISSSWPDVREERAVVADTLEELGHVAFLPETLQIRDSVSEGLAERLRAADLYLGILGTHYTPVPKGQDGKEGESFTELEFRRARELGIPRLFFAKVTEEPEDEALSAFRQRVRNEQALVTFRSPEELRVRIASTLTEWSERREDVGGPSAAPASSSDVARDDYDVVKAFFGTDRDVTGAPESGNYYGGKQGELSWGTVDVSIPFDHRMGELESPSMLRLQFRENPNRHVTVRKLEPLAKEAFIERLRTTIAMSPERDALIFVHGYNASFEEAARRVAQLAYDLKFVGIPLLYSWPSEGATVRYAVDENNVRWTVPHFAELLRLTLTEIGARLVHVIAHGLGTRCVAETLHTFDPTTLGADVAALGQVIFAAPDIDSRTFEDLARGFRLRATRFTLYASSTDRMLAAAKAVTGYPRAGDAGSELLIVDGIDTIDATPVNLVGHSYMGAPMFLADMSYLLREDRPPEQRIGLVAREKGGRRYYAFVP